MASKPILAPYKVITNGDMSQASITSTVSILQSISTIMYGYSWSGSSPVGTIAVQFSNDYSENQDGSVKDAGTWNTISFLLDGTTVTSAPVTGSTGSGAIDIGPTGTYAVRTVYTKISGTGSLQATIAGKTV